MASFNFNGDFKRKPEQVSDEEQTKGKHLFIVLEPHDRVLAEPPIRGRLEALSSLMLN